MSRIAIVGVDGSGKTVLMSALADKFGEPSEDSVYLMPENQASFAFMKQIPHKMRSEHQWPSATTIESFKNLQWTVRIGQKVLMDIEMLDYPGEIYRHAFGERKENEISPHRESIDEFLEHLVTADVLVVLFNLKDALELGKSSKNTETVWLTRSIFEYVKQLPNIKQHLLLFTQADRYPEELSGPGGFKSVLEKHLPMIKILFPDLECAAISINTDDVETPSKDFSESYGVSELMKRLFLHYEEGKTAKLFVDEILHQTQSGVPLSFDIVSMLYNKLENVDPAVLQMVLPVSLEDLNHKLYASWLLAGTDELNNVRASLSNADKLSQLDILVRKYSKCLEMLGSRKPTSWNEQESPEIQSHRLSYSELIKCKSDLSNLVKSHSNEDLAQSVAWRPISDRYGSEFIRAMIKNIEVSYRRQKVDAIPIKVPPLPDQGASKRHIKTVILYTTIIFLILIIVVALMKSDKIRQEQIATEKKAQQEQAVAEKKAQQEQIVAEKKAQQEQLAIKEKVRQSRQHLIRKADSGDPEAQWNLGNLIENETNLMKNLRSNSPQLAEWYALRLAARNWWRKAALQGHLDAQLKMASVTNGDEKIKWLTFASQQGSLTSAIELGDMYFGGYSDDDCKKSIDWYLKALELDAGADVEYKIALLYNRTRNRENAILWFLKAAQKNHIESQKWLDARGLSW